MRAWRGNRSPAVLKRRVRAGRPCLGAPARVRVGVRMREDVDASHAVVDWLDGRRSFTSWVLSD